MKWVEFEGEQFARAPGEHLLRIVVKTQTGCNDLGPRWAYLQCCDGGFWETLIKLMVRTGHDSAGVDKKINSDYSTRLKTFAEELFG